MRRKLRLFYLAWTPPSSLSGATLAMRRHFIEHDDFDTFFASSEAFDPAGHPTLRIEKPAWLSRIGRTRFWRTVRNAELLFSGKHLPAAWIEQARRFQPDAVFTVADLTLSEAARALARHLGVPLISNFQDWWPRGQFYYPQEKPYAPLVPLLERRFRRLYRQSALAFCTSPGMQAQLGPHPNSHVLYPVGSDRPPSARQDPASHSASSKRTLLYTGTAFGSYGVMLRSLARRLAHHPRWQLVIYGKRPDWPAEAIRAAEASGLYRGFLPFEQLPRVLQQAGACLSVMSFDPALELMMRTSFTTKVLDYCSAGRPMIMWGPSFCSPIQLLKKHRAAFTVTSPDPDAVLACLEQLDTNPGLEQRYGDAALRLADGELSHRSIHAVLVNEVERLLAPSTRASGPAA